MTQAPRDEYERAKRLAKAAIEAHKERAKLREPPTADALMKVIQAKAASGEPLTEKEAAALAAALAAANPPKRGRGRPKGTKDRAARRAFRAALVATGHCDLKPYRNASTGHRMTLCDALAESMNESGFASLTTYDAAAAQLKATRKSLKEVAAKLRPFSEHMQAIAKDLSDGFAPASATMQELSERLAPLTERMRATLRIELPPETIEAIKRAEKTRR